MAPTEPPLLEVRELAVTHGHVRALQGVSLEIRRGEIVVLIGANGAGKSTLLETVAGLHTPASGAVLLDGSVIAGRTPDSIVRSGVSLVPEGRGVFGTMTVMDNLLLGAYHHPREAATLLDRVFGWFPVLAERRTQPARRLSGGERQMLSIGRALMSRPRMILVDEPSLGLAPLVVSAVFRFLYMLSQEGYTILLAEQNARKALGLAHRGYVLETGRVSLTGTAAQLLADPRVREAYLGA